MNRTRTQNHFPETMKTSKQPANLSGRFRLHTALLIAAATCVLGNATRAGEMAQRFASPEEAVNSLRLATASADTNALRTILGPAADDLQNPDRIQSTNELKTFSAALIQTNRLVSISATIMVLELGEDLWPFPVPLVKTNGSWFFDTDTGKEELLNRRIGNNELSIIEVMRAYVEAQREYASTDHDDDEVLEFAQRLVSSPGKHDGLYWPPNYEGDLSPFGPLVAYAQAEGYSPELRAEDETKRGPYHGYYFKILLQQGKYAPGGKYNYVTNGNMIGGFAMIGWPAEHGSSGVMTFIVNQQGRVYQKDLGPTTSKIAQKMSEYNPDPTWKICTD
jgi:hypothetical protein